MGLTANPEKISLGNEESKYLGFLVGQGQVKPLADKIEAIKFYRPSSNKKQLRSFLGLTNYYRKFIP